MGEECARSVEGQEEKFSFAAVMCERSKCDGGSGKRAACIWCGESLESERMRL